MKPFGCPIIILNTIDHLGKFDEGFFVGYLINSKAFRVFNSRTRIVKENLHVQFSKNTPNIAGSGPNWLFDIDALTKSMNYKPVVAGNQSNGNVGTKACDDNGKARMETIPGKDYILLPLWTVNLPFSQFSKSSPDAGFKPSGEKEDNVNSTNTVNDASTNEVNAVGGKLSIELPVDPDMPELEGYSIFKDDEDVVYQMDVKSAFLYGKIEEEVYVCQLPGFEDPDFPDRVYKVKKALYVLHQAPRAWYETLSTYLLDNEFQRGKIDKTLFIKRYKEVKTASTPIENQKPLLKDEDGKEVDVHMNRSMIGSLMYLTSSRPDIMFTSTKIRPLVSKRAKDSPFDLVAYTDSDYARASLDRKSTIGEKAKKRKSWLLEKIDREFLLAKRNERIGINILLLVEVNAARHKLTTAGGS
ncbi:retrovirus-related pol polyprotein from transposon TNT 1-94 [Tanacetum coccineum]